MLPQNGQQNRIPNGQPIVPNFNIPSNSPHNFDNSSQFGIDSSIAKQMAALNAANLTRIANNRPPPPSNGTSSGPFLGGMASMNHFNGHDTLNPFGTISGHPGFQAPPLQQSNTNSGQNPSFIDPAMSQPNMAARPIQTMAVAKQKMRNFMTGLVSVMNSRNTPLPPALTGIPSQNYDPNTTPWKNLDIVDIGCIRIAGKEVDLLRFWTTVFQAGGGQKFTQQGMWGSLLTHLDLPEHLPTPHPSGTMQTASVLGHCYMTLLFPFEEAYKRNIHDQQRRAAQAAGRPIGGQPSGSAPGSMSQVPMNQARPPQIGSSNGGMSPAGFPVQGSNSNGSLNGMNTPVPGPSSSGSQFTNPTSLPHTPQLQPSTSTGLYQSLQDIPQNPGQAPQENTISNGGVSAESHLLDQEVQGIKRKSESEEGDLKRVRQKTDSEPPDASTSIAGLDRASIPPSSSSPPPPGTSQTPVVNGSTPARTRPQPSRRKIEYLPLAREVDSYGGRDLNFIEEHVIRPAQRRPLRDINEWGTVDIEALTMSIRSRLSTELSYSLTTFTVLSTMRGQTPGSGFPIFQCPDLFDELLDLLEEESFNDTEDVFEYQPNMPTYREMVNLVQEQESLPFSGLEHRQGSKDPAIGPKQRTGNIILAIINILRNLSIIQDNLTFLSQHDRMLDLILRVCGAERTVDGTPRPKSSALSLSDLITIRKDTLYLLVNTGPLLQFRSSAAPSKTTLRMARRMFELISSFLSDSSEAISPMACIRLVGIPPSGHLKPPLLPDLALEVFTRVGHLDSNRQVFSKATPQAWIWNLFEALVHRLPVADGDYHLLTRELWLSYLEKTVMSIYSLAFLSPPELKKTIRLDRRLGFSNVMLRMVQKALVNTGVDGRTWFAVTARRAIEAMKVIDDSEDSFDTSQSIGPTMAFGMGYGEVGENGEEKGTGLLGGYRDVTWDILLQREMDDVMFSELESLTRIE